MKHIIPYLAIILLFGCTSCQKESNSRPNIVWITAEDMNDWMGCYGDSLVPTPNIDRLAAEGIRFSRAYMTAGVCSASRSAIALGVMQTSFGAHNHRSSRQRLPGEEIHLPDHVRTVYQLMREEGYFVMNSGPKNDFNFLWADTSYHELKKLEGPYGSSVYFTHDDTPLLYDINLPEWGLNAESLALLPDDKPFFLQIQLKGGKNSGRFSKSMDMERIPYENTPVFTDTADLTVMPYYPDIPVTRLEISHHYDCIRQTDEEVGRIIELLKERGLYNNTVIFFWTDHGMRLPRHKQWLYEGSIRVPFIMAGPGIEKGTVRNGLVSGIDITATTLSLGSINIPGWMEGRNMLSGEFNRDYVISARDRCDYTIDKVRAVTTEDYKYIRNFLTDRPFSQPQYRDEHRYMIDMRSFYNTGKMNEIHQFIWKSERTPEELYDLKKDPHEIHNLAGVQGYREVLESNRKILESWIEESGDRGQSEEAKESLAGAYKQWASRAVNPEYEVFRKKDLSY